MSIKVIIIFRASAGWTLFSHLWMYFFAKYGPWWQSEKISIFALLYIISYIYFSSENDIRNWIFSLEFYSTFIGWNVFEFVRYNTGPCWTILYSNITKAQYIYEREIVSGVWTLRATTRKIEFTKGWKLKLNKK